jgi:radical SAM superfamily enzyme YgiQ (UPF0313 family)
MSHYKDAPHILLINPWIDDFAAYDFWAKPMGLLTIAGILRTHGYRITYLDALDRFFGGLSGAVRKATAKRFGRGPYLKTPLLKPARLKDVPRNYSRYGIPEELFRAFISEIPKPDAVLITSIMTYWYPGVFAAIRIVKKLLPDTPVILGGIYATLCREHALSRSGADHVISGPGEEAAITLLGALTGYWPKQETRMDNLDALGFPAFDMQRHIPYVPILTSRGCPFRCRYCASGFLNPKMRWRRPERVIDEILHWRNACGVNDFVFYDDALLIDAESHIIPILEGVIRQQTGVRFHTPNALHIREISAELARILYLAGFATIRLGLETAVFANRKDLDNKVAAGEFEQAVRFLKEAGFAGEQIGVYLLFGLPGQRLSDLQLSIEVVKRAGVRPVLAEYSPVPHTALWQEAVRVSRYDIESDPVFHNNSLFPCWKEGFSWEKSRIFKQMARNACYRPSHK